MRPKQRHHWNRCDWNIARPEIKTFGATERDSRQQQSWETTAKKDPLYSPAMSFLFSSIPPPLLFTSNPFLSLSPTLPLSHTPLNSLTPREQQHRRRDRKYRHRRSSRERQKAEPSPAAAAARAPSKRKTENKSIRFFSSSPSSSHFLSVSRSRTKKVAEEKKRRYRGENYWTLSGNFSE